MTRQDISNIKAVGIATCPMIADAEQRREFVGHLIWMIRASRGNPHFDEMKFRADLLGTSDG